MLSNDMVPTITQIYQYGLVIFINEFRNFFDRSIGLNNWVRLAHNILNRLLGNILIFHVASKQIGFVYRAHKTIYINNRYLGYFIFTKPVDSMANQLFGTYHYQR